jgi:hypothetical protein
VIDSMDSMVHRMEQESRLQAYLPMRLKICARED